MTTLKLYKGVDFDGVNSFPDIPTKATFDAYLAAKQQYSQTVQYNRIGEPILIQKGYDVAISYSYGCIDTGTKKYFIIPDSINVNENGRVYLTYSVDWYTTLKYDSKISFGRSHLIKSTSADPKKYEQSISPIDMIVESGSIIPGDPTKPLVVRSGLLIAYVTDDTKSSFSYIYSPMQGYNGIKDEGSSTWSIDLFDVFSGDLTSITGIAPKDVVGIWFVPFDINSNYMVLQTSATSWWWSFTLVGPSNPYSMTTTLTTDATHVGCITDPAGTVVYTVPYGRTLTKLYYRLIASWSQCFVELTLIYEEGIQSIGGYNAVENSRVLIPCQQIDYNNDTYANWSTGMKGIEIEERRIQKNKALAQGIGGSTLTGAVGGASGSPIGAVAGVVGGIGSAMLSYGLDTYYESKINSLEDRKYQLAQDTMAPGSFVMDNNYNLCMVQLSALQSDIDRYNAEVTNFGADCNIPLTSWTPSPGAYKFADVEVIADVPYGIKQNIKQKLISGIKIVDVT
jgi:hypothetical protein